MAPNQRHDRPDGETQGRTQGTVRYAVVGLGWFAQAAILPAFDNAARAGDGAGPRSELAALVSGNATKLAELGDRYGVEHRVGYNRLEDLLERGVVDAVYIAAPNHMHREFTLNAARAGAHVLCEKPLAVSERDCDEMTAACREAGVKLMTAYRLHFEPGNLEAVRLADSGELGELRLFSSVFASQVTNQDDIRLNPIEDGGGSVYDLGVYCINAARYLFRAEPQEVAAYSVRGAESSDPERFADCDETTSVTMRFPGGRLASFVTSLGATDRDAYRLLGTRGELLVEPAYEFKATIRHRLTIDGETSERQFPERDQVAPEIVHFTECILGGKDPEPDGREGLADVRIVEAIHRSAAEGGRPVQLPDFPHQRRPVPEQAGDYPAPGQQDLVETEKPSD
ncbi:MAG TPA: Gfo/Idh/MocA family oxidoreductase [Thermoanaerobaculia bacterium]|nr:Gfo/Idh/MocA family oxidoreductase [Thermoanaerobaculia bacterium]